MSKIQKALKALRTSPDAAKVDGEQKRQYRRPNVPGRSPNLDDTQDLVSDMTPMTSVQIDTDALVEMRMLPAHHDEETIAQQFRRIKRPILQVAFDDNLPGGDHANAIMMASALPGAGKSFCALNLARSIALERDYGCVLVDADVLKPGISKALGLEDRVGLIDYLSNPELNVAEIMYATNINDIVVIPAGQRHPEATELLASRRMHSLMQKLSENYMNHVIVFDTPPLLLTSEAQVLAEQVGQIVLVIEDRSSSQDSVIRALGMLDRSKPINAILNKSRSAHAGGYHSDDYGYYSSTARYARRSAGNEDNN